MSGEKDGLSDDEYAALLKDLEGRSGSDGGRAASEGEGDIEDIEAFLRELEGEAESSVKSSTKTATRSEEEDALAAEFAALEAKGELVALPEDEEEPKAREKKAKKKRGRRKKERPEKKRPEKEKKKSRAERRAEKEAARADAGEGVERSRGKRAGLFLLKNLLWFTPALILWWVLGAYLGQWISAGWLIAAVSTMFVFGAPAVLRRLVRRGRYRPWSLGFSLLAAVLLIAPMPHIAAQNIARYGHWPSTAIGEAVGSEPDAAYIRAHGRASGWLAGLIGAGPVTLQARQLGTTFGLDVERPKDPVIPPVSEPEGEVNEPQEPVLEEGSIGDGEGSEQ